MLLHGPCNALGRLEKTEDTSALLTLLATRKRIHHVGAFQIVAGSAIYSCCCWCNDRLVMLASEVFTTTHLKSAVLDRVVHRLSGMDEREGQRDRDSMSFSYLSFSQ